MKSGVNVHLYPSPMTHESRILKETEAVASFTALDPILLVGTSAHGLPDHEVVDSRRQIIRLSRTPPMGFSGSPGKALGVAGWSVRAWRRLARRRVACINCHSLPVLPLAVALKRRTGARLVYDTHELETESNGLGGLRRTISKRVERTLFKFVDETIVVSDGIADWYQREYGGPRPTVVFNCPPWREPQRTDLLRRELGLNPDVTVFLYQGVLSAGRGIELMLDAFAGIDDPRKVLIFMGMGPMESLVAECSRRRRNVHLRPAVPPHVVGHYTASADVGMCLIADTCLSYHYCMPNKLFEYMMAGIPTVVSDLPEIAHVVVESGAGWVVPQWSPESLRSTLSSIDAGKIAAGRRAALDAARIHTWERQLPALRSVYERLALAGPESGRVVPSPVA